MQNQGIGTKIVKDLIVQSQKNKQSICLDVLKSNSKALSFYKRLGFVLSGEDEMFFHLSYNESHTDQIRK